MSTTPTTRASYAGGRRLLDADSHIMVLPNFLAAHADPDVRDRLPEIDYSRSSVEREDVLVILANGVRHDRAYADPTMRSRWQQSNLPKASLDCVNTPHRGVATALMLVPTAVSPRSFSRP